MKQYKRIDNDQYLVFNEDYNAKISFKMSKKSNIEVDIRDLFKLSSINKKELKIIAVNIFAYKYLTEEYKLI